MPWHRIKKPQACGGCGKSDWCLVNDNASEFLCMRAVSSTVTCLSDGSIGYIHRVAGSTKPISPQPKKEPTPLIDFHPQWDKARRHTPPSALCRLSDQLGLKVSALMEMGVAWGTWVERVQGESRHRSAWWFPMRDWSGTIIGLRTRDWNGNKWSVQGSRNGLFIPNCPPEKELWVVEGPTDAAALRQLNTYCVGRPAALSGLNDLKLFVISKRFDRVCIIADNDTPKPGMRDVGMDGAETLARHLPCPTCIITLPCKDVREGLAMGLNYETLSILTNTAVWRTQ